MSDFKEILPLVEANIYVAKWTDGRAGGRTHITKVTNIDGNYLRAPKD